MSRNGNSWDPSLKAEMSAQAGDGLQSLVGFGRMEESMTPFLLLMENTNLIRSGGTTVNWFRLNRQHRKLLLGWLVRWRELKGTHLDQLIEVNFPLADETHLSVTFIGELMEWLDIVTTFHPQT